MIPNRMKVIKTCNNVIYDNGGMYSDYASNSADTLLILPDAEVKRVNLTFQHVAINNHFGYDMLEFVGGLKTSATNTLMSLSGYQRSYNGYPLASMQTDGSVKFYFISDSNYVAQGFRAFVTCSSDATVTPTHDNLVPATGTVNITSCGDTIYDNGYKFNYQSNTNGVLVITPQTAGKRVRLQFQEFSLASGDVMTIYNGSSTASPIIKTLTGNTIPSIITASSSNTSGVLTVKFTSNASEQSSGFKFITSCIDPLPESNFPNSGTTLLKTCTNTIFDNGGLIGNYSNNLNSSMLIKPSSIESKIRISFNEFNLLTGDSLFIYNGLDINAQRIAALTGASIPATINATTDSGSLFLLLKTDASGVSSGFSIQASCNIPSFDGLVIPTNGSTVVSVCDTTIYANGGDQNYLPNSNGYIVINPKTPGKTIKIHFDYFQTESGYDSIKIYNGVGFNTLIGNYSGNINISDIISMDPCGALTIMFTSDNSVQRIGFKIQTSCVDPPIEINIPASGNIQITTCDETIYDIGGSMGNYNNSMDGSITIYPGDSNKYVTVYLDFLNTETTYDYINFYDGTSIASPLIKNVSGISSVPILITASNAQSALTIRFRSDVSNTSQGFRIKISCIDESHMMPLNSRIYKKTCDYVIYDNGGSTGTYSNKIDSSIVILSPNSSNQKLKLTFLSFDTESPHDKLEVYSGVYQLANRIGVYFGSTIPDPIISPTAGIPIILNFKTDVSVVKNGFAISVSCIDEDPTSIEESESLTSVKIYPNPTNSKFMIENIAIDSKINIFNSNGQLVHQTTSSNTSIEINSNSWLSGLYLIMIDNGDIVEKHKLSIVK